MKALLFLRKKCSYSLSLSSIFDVMRSGELSLSDESNSSFFDRFLCLLRFSSDELLRSSDFRFFFFCGLIGEFDLEEEALV